MYLLDSPVQTQLTRNLEEEKARQFCNIPFDIYNEMVGSRRYAHLSPYCYGAIVCKADVIVVYRLLSKVEPVGNDITSKQNK